MQNQLMVFEVPGNHTTQLVSKAFRENECKISVFHIVYEVPDNYAKQLVPKGPVERGARTIVFKLFRGTWEP